MTAHLSRLLCALLAVCSALVESGRAAEPGGSPAPGATAALVALVSEAKTPFRIVVRSPKSPVVGFAVEELAKYVARISGAALEIGAGRRPGPTIVIGLRKDLSAADRKVLPAAAKGWDGYAIGVLANVGGFPRIVLGGDEPRGVVYGVYDLLERLGCRFVHPALDPSDPEIVPRAASLMLPVDAWAVASPMRYRTLAWFEWRKPNPDDIATTPEQLVAQIDWAMKSRYNVFQSSVLELPPKQPLAAALSVAKRRGMLLQAPGHNFDLFLPSDEKTFAEHPEWFGMRKGLRVGHGVHGAQFCWTNQAAQEKFIERVIAFVRERPDLDILELSGIDGGSYAPACSCEQCAKHSPTDNVIALLNAVVARLAAVAPHVVVETLGGYQYSATPPKDVQPDPRLRVLWAHWGRAATLSFSSKMYFKRRQMLETWASAFDARLTVFQYYSDYFANAWFTAPLAEQIEGDRRYVLELGVDGMLTLLYPDGYWWRSSLNGYLAGRSFYDATADPFVLLREYALAYYGPAGELMAAYLDEWARNPRLGMHSRQGAQPEHRTELAAQRRKYLEPAASLVAADAVLLRRVATIESLHRLAETNMEVDISLSQAKALRTRGKRRMARHQIERARLRLADAQKLADTLVAEKRGLVDGEIGLSVFAAKAKTIKVEEQLLDQRPASPTPVPAPGAAPTDASQRPSSKAS